MIISLYHRNAILLDSMSRNKKTSILVFDFVINSALTVVELLAGTVSGSIALLADGFQNLTDSIVITIAYITERLTSKKGITPKKQKSVYKTAGMMNASILITLAIYIGYNAFDRLLHPQQVDTTLVIWIGLLSTTVNWMAAGLLYGMRQDKSIRAPYVGLFFSGLSGAAVFASGILAKYLHIENIDAITGLAIASLLLIRSFGLYKLAAKNK